MGNNQNVQQKKKQPSKVVLPQITQGELYKIVIEGNEKVGKQSLINRFLDGKLYKKGELCNVSFRYPTFTTVFSLDGKNIGLELFKLDRYYGHLFTSRTHVFVFMFDITDKSTFVKAKELINLNQTKFEEKDAVVILVGNKIDCQKREVHRSIVEDYINQNKFFYYETSTTTGQGLKELFGFIEKHVIERSRGLYQPIQYLNTQAMNPMLSNAPNPLNPLMNMMMPNNAPPGISNQPFAKPGNTGGQTNYEELYNIEKNKIFELQNKIIEQQKEIDQLKKELDAEKQKNTGTAGDPNKLFEILQQISQKDNEIKALKEQLDKIPFKLNENESLYSIIIASEDKSTLCPLICKNTDKFSKIEEKFYEVCSEYSNSENSFYINDNKIKKFQTLEDNGIKNYDLIIVKKEEN